MHSFFAALSVESEEKASYGLRKMTAKAPMGIGQDLTPFQSIFHLRGEQLICPSE